MPIVCLFNGLPSLVTKSPSPLVSMRVKSPEHSVLERVEGGASLLRSGPGGPGGEGRVNWGRGCTECFTQI